MTQGSRARARVLNRPARQCAMREKASGGPRCCYDGGGGLQEAEGQRRGREPRGGKCGVQGVMSMNATRRRGLLCKKKMRLTGQDAGLIGCRGPSCLPLIACCFLRQSGIDK